MASNSVSRERKRELEQLDPFQENLLKAVAIAKQYKRPLIFGIGAVALVIIVFSGIIYSFERAENKAAQNVTQALKSYAELDDPARDFSKVEESFKHIFSEYANTSAGRQAKVKFAKICYDASKYDLSYKYYKEALEIFENDALMGNLILSSLGQVCLAKKDYEEAEKYFLKIEKGKNDLMKDDARYALAMIYEAGNKTGESKKMYEKIASGPETSMYHSLASDKLARMK